MKLIKNIFLCLLVLLLTSAHLAYANDESPSKVYYIQQGFSPNNDAYIKDTLRPKIEWVFDSYNEIIQYSMSLDGEELPVKYNEQKKTFYYDLESDLSVGKHTLTGFVRFELQEFRFEGVFTILQSAVNASKPLKAKFQEKWKIPDFPSSIQLTEVLTTDDGTTFIVTYDQKKKVSILTSYSPSGKKGWQIVSPVIKKTNVYPGDLYNLQFQNKILYASIQVGKTQVFSAYNMSGKLLWTYKSNSDETFPEITEKYIFLSHDYEYEILDKNGKLLGKRKQPGPGFVEGLNALTFGEDGTELTFTKNKNKNSSLVRLRDMKGKQIVSYNIPQYNSTGFITVNLALNADRSLIVSSDNTEANPAICKYSSTGKNLWCYKLNSSEGSVDGLIVDDKGQTYAAINDYEKNLGIIESLIKLSPDGKLLWKVYKDEEKNQVTFFHRHNNFVFDASGNIHYGYEVFLPTGEKIAQLNEENQWFAIGLDGSYFLKKDNYFVKLNYK